MKDWSDKECLDFVNHLKTNVNWGGQEKTVQVYYCPAHYDSPKKFRYIDFENFETMYKLLEDSGYEGEIPEPFLAPFKEQWKIIHYKLLIWNLNFIKLVFRL